MTRPLFIPPLGTEITLAEDWTFDLYREHRNDTLIEMFGIKFPDRKSWGEQQFHTVTLPAGSVLKMDRIYIKKGQGEFDSVTFYLKGHTRPSYTRTSHTGLHSYKMPKRPVRFWAKLHDANKIVMEDVEALDTSKT